MRRALVACLVVAACGDNQQPVEVAVPYGTPAFVGYKAAGAWHVAKPTEHGYQILSDGPYQFVFVCGDDQTFDVEELFADPSDGDQELTTQVANAACRAGRNGVSLAEVTGTVVQPGTVELGRGGGSGGDAPNWSYDLATGEGPQAMVFRPTTADVIVLRRDVAVGPGVNPQPAIDARTEQTPLVRGQLTFYGDSNVGVPVATMTTLETGDGQQLVIAFGDAMPLLLRPSDLEAGERQLVDLDLDESTSDTPNIYNDHIRLDATDLAVKLQPAPTVTYATSDLATSVAWAHEPGDAVSFELLVSTGGTPSLIHGVATPTASRDSKLDLAVDREAPGFLDAWRPLWSRDLASSSRSFRVEAAREGGCYETLLVDRGRVTAFISPTSRCDAVLR